MKIYVLIRYPVDLIGVYRTLEGAQEAKKDYVENEDQLYIDCDTLQD